LKTVRRHFLYAFALVVALLGAGCGERDGAPLPAETEDPYYVQGKQLQKQGRNAEALNAYLKVIDRRGDNPSPESHLEAGQICLNHTKDPLAACYHFRCYLKAHPNSKETRGVIGMVEAAKREFARSLPGRPMEDQSVRMAVDEEVGKLRRENEELRAELAVLRGGGAVPVPRLPRMITLPAEVRSASPSLPPPVAAVIDAPVTPAPVGPQTVAQSAAGIQRMPPPATKQSRASPMGPAPKSALAAGRTHTVAAKDTLYGIARRYNVKVEDIVAANPAIVPRVSSPLRVGTALRIP
jgi:LysM repeat protein